MSDFPGIVDVFPGMRLSTTGEESLVLDELITNNGVGAFAAWPSANLGIYVPVLVQTPITIKKMCFEVGAQAGTYDIGIYDSEGKRLVSLGSTTVPVVGLAVADVADTTLSYPGVYYLALVCSTVTTLTVARTSGTATGLPLSGMKQQAIGSTTLPDPWTAIDATTGVVPHIMATAQSAL